MAPHGDNDRDDDGSSSETDSSHSQADDSLDNSEMEGKGLKKEICWFCQ